MNIYTIWTYLGYVIRHKWFVMIECFKAGLIWRGIVHDLSKFLPDEFFPYANYFYWKPGDKTKYYHSKDENFDLAWLKHQKRNKHHWQWWKLSYDDGGTIILSMSKTFRTEMVCDWIGAGKAQGYGDNPFAWYTQNKNKMQLHKDTRKWIEAKLS